MIAPMDARTGEACELQYRGVWMQSKHGPILLVIASLLHGVMALPADAQTTQPSTPSPSGRRSKRAAAGPRVVRNIPYAEIAGADRRLTSLDIYAPRKGKNHPVVVWIHGGGWAIGDKGWVGHKPGLFTGEGYLLVSINYRLAPAVTHPTYVQDVAAAIAWVHRHIKEYGGNPDCILLIGHSAGAHLAALVATDERRLREAGSGLGVLKGVVLVDGAGYDIPGQMRLVKDTWLGSLYRSAFGTDPTVWEDASPIRHVAKGKGIPPFLILYSGGRLAAGMQASALADALRTADVQAEVAGAPDKNHMTIDRDIGAPKDKPTERIVEFFRTCTQNRATSRPSDTR